MEEWLDDNKHLLGTIAMCVLVVQVGTVTVVTTHTHTHVTPQSPDFTLMCVFPAPGHGVLHDAVPADPQDGKEVRGLKVGGARCSERPRFILNADVCTGVVYNRVHHLPSHHHVADQLPVAPQLVDQMLPSETNRSDEPEERRTQLRLRSTLGFKPPTVGEEVNIHAVFTLVVVL